MTRRLRLNDFPLDRLYLHICGSLFYTRLHKYNDFLTFLDNFLGCDESVFIIYILPLILVNDKERKIINIIVLEQQQRKCSFTQGTQIILRYSCFACMTHQQLEIALYMIVNVNMV